VKVARRQRDAVVVLAACRREGCIIAARAEPRRRVRAAAAVESDGAAVQLRLPARTRRSTRLKVIVTAVDEAGNATSKDRRVSLLR
jgi:hypothetical protein